MIRITLDLPANQAAALAQFCQRFYRSDAARYANRFDGGRECDAILAGAITLQRALAEAGFAPEGLVT